MGIKRKAITNTSLLEDTLWWYVIWFWSKVRNSLKAINASFSYFLFCIIWAKKAEF